MALVPLFRAITQEQLGGQVPSWFVTFLGQFNDFATKVTYGYQGNINYTTNIACQIVNLTFTTPSTYTSGQGFPTVSWTNQLVSNPFAVTIGQISRTNGGTGFDSPSNPIWTQNGNTVTINWIGGLQPSCSYSITLLVR